MGLIYTYLIFQYYEIMQRNSSSLYRLLEKKYFNYLNDKQNKVILLLYHLLLGWKKAPNLMYAVRSPKSHETANHGYLVKLKNNVWKPLYMASRWVLLKLHFTMNFQYFLLILIRERLQIKTVKGDPLY